MSFIAEGIESQEYLPYTTKGMLTAHILLLPTMKSVLLILYSALVVSSVHHRWPDSSSEADNALSESGHFIISAPVHGSWPQANPQKDDTFDADLLPPLLSKCAKNNYRCLQRYPLPLFQQLGQDVDDEKWLEMVGIHLPSLQTITTPTTSQQVTPVSNYVRLPSRRGPNRPLNLTALHVQHGTHHKPHSSIYQSALINPATAISSPFAFSTVPTGPTTAISISTASITSSVHQGLPNHISSPTKPANIKLGLQNNPTSPAILTLTVLDLNINPTVNPLLPFTHNPPAYSPKPTFTKPSQHIHPSVMLQNTHQTAITRPPSVLTQIVRLQTRKTTRIPEEKTVPSRTTRSTPKTPTTHETHQAISSTQTINPVFTPPDLPVSLATDIQTVQHALVFKMLLLIAFVAVPILAAAAPILFSTGRTSRKLEDEAIIDWAAETATMLSLAHLVMDQRITKLLQLEDEEFASTLSAALSESIARINGMPQDDLKDASRSLKTVFMDLIAMVKGKTKQKQFEALPTEDKTSSETYSLTTSSREYKPSREKETRMREKAATTTSNAINIKTKLWNSSPAPK